MENPPVNRLLQLLKQKPPDPSAESQPDHAPASPMTPSDKTIRKKGTRRAAQSDTQPATKSDIQGVKSSIQPVSSSSTQPALLRDTQPATKSDIQGVKSDIQPATKSDTRETRQSSIPSTTESNTPIALTSLSKGQQRALQFLMSNRGGDNPSQTVPVGYDMISKACFLSRSGSRKVIRELCHKGLIQRTETKRGEIQGSVYLVKSDIPYVTNSSIPYFAESNTPPATESDILICSSSKELLLQKLIIEDAFQDLNPRSLVPYLDQFDTTAALQDFLDMTNACITAAKEGRGKPIKNPHGFLFAQLRQSFINPPEGYKSRRVHAQEIKNQLLEEELATLQQLKEQEKELRFALFSEKLTEDDLVRLEREAKKQVNPKIGMSTERQIEVHKEDILKQWFVRQETP